MAEDIISQERYSSIRKAVEKARLLGIKDRSQIAEAVIDSNSAQAKGILNISREEASQIPSIGKKDIRSEPEEVKQRAINKYFEFKEGSKNVPVLIDAIHAVTPGSKEIEFLFSQMNLDDKLSDKEKKKVVLEFKNKFCDEFTADIAQAVAKKTDSALIIAGKSKAFAEANRYWWKREAKNIEVKGSKNPVFPYEYSRRIKAALFWSIDKILHNNGMLDEKGELMRPFFRLSVHGMENNENFDFAIAGSRNIADQEKVEMFANLLRKNIKQVGLNVDGETPKVVIALKEDPKTKKYSGAASLNQYRKESDNAVFQHPSFGRNFQNIQLEISARLRKDELAREKVVDVLAGVVQELR